MNTLDIFLIKCYTVNRKDKSVHIHMARENPPENAQVRRVFYFRFWGGWNQAQLPSYFKLFNFSVDVSNLSCVERLTLYIKLQQRFLKKKLVAVYNLKACLSSDELNLFYQTILYEKLHILLIEDIQRNHPLPIEHTFIIDRDLCIF